MKITSALFIKSSTKLSQCPPPDRPEFAFIGRSNVGKSSLINMLVGNSKLAKISSKPGKTQTLNHFDINESWYLVDLPGYGFASVSRATRLAWTKMMENYFLKRENLACVFVLVDSRLEPQQSDLEFINWLGGNDVPLTLVFTKTDKISKNQVTHSLLRYKNKLKEVWNELPTMVKTSIKTKIGKAEILGIIGETLRPEALNHENTKPTK
jgi:GTP-binding protein